jgi:hypothetical protein
MFPATQSGVTAPGSRIEGHRRGLLLPLPPELFCANEGGSRLVVSGGRPLFRCWVVKPTTSSTVRLQTVSRLRWRAARLGRDRGPLSKSSVAVPMIKSGLVIR